MSSSRDQRRQLYERLVGTEVAGGRYKITDLLGFGGMGAVYEALQRGMDRNVAIKLIPTHDPTIVARFEREALTISKLRHPNTVTVFDYGQGDDGFLFLAMEILHGRTLSEAIEDGPISPERAVHITSQICRSLGEAHRAGIVHRDIKPDNIILIRVDQDHDFVKVLDFGIAKAVMGEDDVKLTGDGRIIGTPRYMSPEQILAEPIDHRSDIYSLGCILYEMLCGAPPFEQSSTTALMISHTQDPPPLFSQRLDSDKLAQMPRALEQVVRRGLAKSPTNRHQTTDEMREELEAAIEGRLEPAPAPFEAESTAAAIPSSMASGATGTGSQPVPVHITQSSELARPGAQGLHPAIYGIMAVLFVIAGLIGYQIVAGGAEPTADALVAETTPAATTPDPFEQPAVEPAVEPGTTAEPAPPPAKPGYVMLDIRGKPAGASVKLGDRKVGQTPIHYAVRKDKELVSLVVSKEGYHDFQIVLPLDDGKEKREISYRLDPKKKKRKSRPPKPSPEPPKPDEEEDGEETPSTPGPTPIDLIDEKPTTDVPILK